MRPKATTERFLAMVERTDGEAGCWLWTGSLFPKTGYGTFWFEGRTVSAHRFSYEAFVGPIPDGLNVLHRCDVRRCVRPDHLFLGTHLDNSRDMVAKGRKERGTDHHGAKLTDDQVRAIRRRFAEGASLPELAADTGCTRQNIGQIVRRKTWRHVD